MNIDPQFGFLALAGALAIAYLIAKFVWKTDSKVEAQRRVAFTVAASLKAKGLKILPGLLEDYAVGDYSGIMIKVNKIFIVLTHDPSAVDKEFEAVFGNILISKLADPAEKAKLVALINATNVTAKVTPAS